MKYFAASSLSPLGSLYDLDELQKWVGEVYGDKELAETIGEKIKEGSSYKEQVEAIKPLMEQRLRQCERIVGVDTEA